MVDPSDSHAESLLASVRDTLTRGESGSDVSAKIEQALLIARSTGEPPLIAHALLYKANDAMIKGDLRGAVSFCHEGLELVRGKGLHLEADLLVMESRQVLANDVQRALDLTSQAMAVSSSIFGTARPNVMIRRAEAIGASGDVQGAIALLKQAEAISEVDGDTHGRLTALNALNIQLINAEQYESVIEYTTESIDLAEQLGRSMAKVNAFKFLAMALGRTGHLAEAFEVGQRALDLAERQFPGAIVGDCNGVLGDIYLELNDLRSALVCYSRALRIYRETGHLNGQAMCLMFMGETYARAQEVEQAEKLLDRAEKLAREIGNEVIIKRTVYARAGLLVRLERDTPASSKVDAALHAFRAIAGSTTSQKLPDPEEIERESLSPVPHDDRGLTTRREEGIHVTMMGSFKVIRNGHEISMDEWKRKKARDVFKVLASNHRRSLHVDEIVQRIWGDDMEVERCLPTLQNAISIIRSLLEPGIKPRQPSAFLHFRDGSYLLDLGPTGRIDVEEFTWLAREALAKTPGTERLAALQNAVDRYAGEYLPDDRFEGWTDHERGVLKDLASETLHQLAAAQFEAGNNAAAKVALQRAVQLEE